EMIEKCYAAHIKTSLDAAAINVMRPKEKGETRRREGLNALTSRTQARITGADHIAEGPATAAGVWCYADVRKAASVGYQCWIDEHTLRGDNVEERAATLSQ